MTRLLATVAAAGLATVQDGGRHGYAHVGVPGSGAWHRERYLQATAGVRGVADPTCPTVEILDGGARLTVHVDVTACVTGPVTWRVDGHRAAVGATVRVHAGADVAIEHRGPGPSYLAIAGWSAPPTLGSASTDTFSRLGGAVVAAGYQLHGDASVPAPEAGAFHRALPEPVGPVGIVEAGSPLLGAFVEQDWHVEASARSGVRLSGAVLPASATVASAPMVPGAVQLTPSGEAIVLGPDGGVTGGYPVVGVVATVDLDRISLLRPGDPVSWRTVDVRAAADARADRRARLHRSLTRVHLLA